MRSVALLVLLAASSARAGEPFFLAGPGIPLGGALALGPLEGEPAAGGPGAMTLGDSDFVSARPLPRPPAPFDALVGQRVALHGAAGRVCTATIAAVLAVRTGTTWGDTRLRLRAAAGPPAEPLWKDGDGVKVWQTYAAATLKDPSGPCEGALFAVPERAALTTGKLQSADAAWRAPAESAFLDSKVVRLRQEKTALEGGSFRPRFTSVRRVGPAEGPSLALIYGSLNGARLVVVHAVPAAAFTGTTELGSVFADSPSFVAGVDADRDGKLDAVVGHPHGVALFTAAGNVTCLVDGSFTANRCL